MLNEKQKIEVTLLSIKEVRKIIKTLKEARPSKVYWTSTKSYFYDSYIAGALVVHSIGETAHHDITNRSGVLPILKTDSLDELINNCQTKMINDLQIAEYGQFPNLFKIVKIYDTSCLKKTGKKYLLPPQTLQPVKFDISSFSEYEYLNQKVIKINEQYHPIEPVSFYVDRENSMLVSTDVLFYSPVNIDNPTYNGNFQTSQLYQYLNNEFIKELVPDKEIKYSQNETNIPGFMNQSVNQEELDEVKKSLIRRIDNLIRKNVELQLISEEMSRELNELKSDVKRKKYVK